MYTKFHPWLWSSTKDKNSDFPSFWWETDYNLLYAGKKMETIPLIYITFSHLADNFIQSDLQMRIIEAIKTKSRLA